MKFTRFFLARRTRLLLSSVENDATQTQKIKDKIDDQINRESVAFSKIASYPNRSLTRPVIRLMPDQISSTLFTSNLNIMISVATNLRCLSLSAPKIHWDAAVVVIRRNIDETEFDVWVNPQVPGYDDRHSIAPMYGMWENCVSCGLNHAWVVRTQRITCTGLDMVGNKKEEVLDGMRARCLMHELDHLNGKTIFHKAIGPEFVVSGTALSQRDLWPPNFPSAEAHITPAYTFFDYVTNTTVIPKGLELWFGIHESSQHFTSQRLTK
ncbi:unnamed protein product [Phytomonas sp. Hart1]|nr:unnamed protein product [Phytomonas sp. Hart1]|eukprot:CCW70619.1 unnamed protein product [Phytomonas sp. isolate Hart1]